MKSPFRFSKANGSTRRKVEAAIRAGWHPAAVLVTFSKAGNINAVLRQERAVNENPVEKIRQLLGHDVLLLPWPCGSKGTKRKWGHLTVADMTPAYLKKLERGNIGVALGKKSGDLVALDVDDDHLVEPYLALNPWLKDTLQTHGARGRVFWLRMAGDYPGVTKTLKNLAGEECGEWRAGENSQSIIHGIHPSGAIYKIIRRVKPVIVKFSSIIWPAEISNPPKLEIQLPVAATEETEDTEDTKDTGI